MRIYFLSFVIMLILITSHSLSSFSLSLSPFFPFSSSAPLNNSGWHRIPCVSFGCRNLGSLKRFAQILFILFDITSRNSFFWSSFPPSSSSPIVLPCPFPFHSIPLQPFFLFFIMIIIISPLTLLDCSHTIKLLTKVWKLLDKEGKKKFAKAALMASQQMTDKADQLMPEIAIDPIENDPNHVCQLFWCVITLCFLNLCNQRFNL